MKFISLLVVSMMIRVFALYDVFNESKQKIGEFDPSRNKLILTRPTTLYSHKHWDYSKLLPVGEYYRIRGRRYNNLLKKYDVPVDLKYVIDAYYKLTDNDEVVIQLFVDECINQCLVQD